MSELELIYREDVIARLKKAEYVFGQNGAKLEATGIHYALELVESYYEIPTVERPHGKWIDVDEDWFDCKCSICGLQSRWHWNYCPNCGADMRGEEE